MSPSPLFFQLDTYRDYAVSAALQDRKNWKEIQLQTKLAGNLQIDMRMGNRNHV